MQLRIEIGPLWKKALILTAFSLQGILAWTSCGGPQRDGRIQSVVSPAALHVHELSINYRQIASGVREFPLQEAAGHRHVVRLTEDEAAVLLTGTPVILESSEEQFHKHAVTLQLFGE
ncbi:MAG: hypothetical protein K1X75_09420 [Leptospirales bacterium]|nr:hypothetical protein [Leptospirales bacterium]